MDNQSNVKFSFTVPFNNEDIIQSRNKKAKCELIASSLFALFLIIAAVVMLNILSYDNMAWFLFYLFSGAAFFSLATAIIYLVVSKKNNESDNKSFRYDFYEDKVKIFKITKNEKEKTKKIYNCSYKKPFFGQCILKITEYAKDISMLIFISVTTCCPVYDTVIIPKSLLSDEMKRELIEFLKQKVGSHYVVKIK